jgi:hypothetical protein
MAQASPSQNSRKEGMCKEKKEGRKGGDVSKDV